MELKKHREYIFVKNLNKVQFCFTESSSFQMSILSANTLTERSE